MKGHIRQRGKTFTAYWSTTDPATGKRVQHAEGGFVYKGKDGPKGKGAQSRLNAILEQVQQNTWCPDTKMTVGELLDEWLAAQEVSGLRSSTVVSYRKVVEGWLRPHLAAVPVATLNAQRVQDLVAVLKSPEGSQHGRGALSPRSAQEAVGTLKAATAWAHGAELLARDPLAGVKRPKAPSTSAATSAWSPEEAGAFLSSVKGDRLEAAWWLLLSRGLRRGELLGLRWQDVQRDAIQIVRTRVVVGGEVVDSVPKTERGRRSVPLDDRLTGLLRAHKAHQGAEKLAAGAAWEKSGLVFVDELGRPLRPEFISRRFTALNREAGLRSIRFHDLRHTAASMLLAAGEPVKVVSEMLGHASVLVTMSIYQHILPAMGAAAGERLSERLAGAALTNR